MARRGARIFELVLRGDKRVEKYTPGHWDSFSATNNDVRPQETGQRNTKGMRNSRKMREVQCGKLRGARFSACSWAYESREGIFTAKSSLKTMTMPPTFGA